MSNNKQQTAVEWLIEELLAQFYLQIDSLMAHELKGKFEQAKEMEKQQIRNAYNDGHTDGITAKPGLTSGTMYYNQTYGGGEQ